MLVYSVTETVDIASGPYQYNSSTRNMSAPQTLKLPLQTYIPGYVPVI